MVLVHSDKGQEFLKRVDDRIISKEVDVQEGIRYNPAAVNSVTRHPLRDEFFSRLDHDEIDKLIQKFCRDRFLVRVKRRAKSGAKTLVRKIGLLPD